MTVSPATDRAPFGRRPLSSLSTLGLGLALLAAGCARGPAGPRNLLLVTIDTLRSDRLGTYGNSRVLTPTMDRLAARGVLFSDAYAQIPSTLPSHASILTGLYPTAHGVHDNGVYYLDERETTLAEILAQAGFETAAFIGAFVLDHRFGINQGFEVYDDTMESPLRRGAPPAIDGAANPVASWWVGAWFGAYQRPGESVVRAATAWLRGRQPHGAERPFFLWVHLFDPHEPYDAPAPLATLYDAHYNGALDGTGDAFAAALSAGTLTPRDIDHMRARYDGEVTYADRCLGALLDSIEALGWGEETLVAVIADHGEGMGEHDYYFEHGSRLWEPLLRVPFILSGPGVPAGRIVGGRVRSVDVAPTLAELLGIPAPSPIDGASLLPLIDGEPESRDSYAETQCGLQAMPVPESFRAFSSGSWKLIASSPRERAAASAPPAVALYDLAQDPGETRDLSGERPRILRDLLGSIAKTAAGGRRDSTAALNTRAMDDETVAKLRALGYVR